MGKEIVKDRPVMDYFKASALLLKAGMIKGLRNLFFGVMSGTKSLSMGTSVILFLILSLVFMNWTLMDTPPTMQVSEEMSQRDAKFIAETDTSYVDEFYEEEIIQPPKKVKRKSKYPTGEVRRNIPPWELTAKSKGWDNYRYQVWKIAGEIRREIGFAQPQSTIYDWSMKLFYHESKHTPTIVNSIGAQGLFQAIRSTRKDLKVSNLHLLPVEKQLKYYKEYVRGVIGKHPQRVKDFTDWYFIGLYPSLVGAPDNTVFASKYGSKRSRKIYKLNKIDPNNDGVITKKELGDEVMRRCINHR